MSVLLFMSSVFADTASADAATEAPECDLVTVAATLPDREGWNVPLDVAPVAILHGDCDGPSQWTLRLTGGDQELEETFDFDYDKRWQHFRTFPEAELLPDTDYQLDVVPGDGGWSEQASVSFETGSHRSEGLSGGPLITDGEAWFYDYDTSVEIGGRFTVSPGIDADGLSLLHVVDGDGTLLKTAVVGDGELSFDAATTWASSPPTEDLCFSVYQEDAAGRASAVETLCLPAEERFVEEDASGCSTGGAAAALFPALLALAGLRRRR